MAQPRKVKMTEDATEFWLPSLQEIHPDFAATAERRADVESQRAAAQAELGALHADLKANLPSRQLRDSVAEMLGDVVAADERPARLGKLKTTVDDCEVASEILRRRLDQLRGPASAAVRAAIAPEFAARVGKMCQALEVVREARAAIDALLDDLEAGDVDRGSLTDFRGHFLGDRRDGHIDRFLRQAKEAGYHGGK